MREKDERREKGEVRTIRGKEGKMPHGARKRYRILVS